MDIHVAIDAQTAAEDAADWVAAQVRNAVRRRGAASLALSGGSTPALMLAGLVRRDVPWGQVTVWQVDERVAPDGDPARNAGLLDVLPLRRAQVRLMPVTARHLSSAVRRYAAGLPERFDVVHLGMGDDGFLGPAARGHAWGTLLRLAGVVLWDIVLSNFTVARLVLAPGAAKAGPMRRWLLEDRLLPIQRVRRTATVVVIDAAAAAQLPAASPPT